MPAHDSAICQRSQASLTRPSLPSHFIRSRLLNSPHSCRCSCVHNTARVNLVCNSINNQQPAAPRASLFRGCCCMILPGREKGEKVPLSKCVWLHENLLGGLLLLLSIMREAVPFKTTKKTPPSNTHAHFGRPSAEEFMYSAANWGL